MVRTQILLTSTQASALKRLAAEENVSMAELVRRSIDRLVESGLVADREEIRKRSLSAIGCFRSGLSDLGSNHDEYLAEAYAE